MFPPELTATTLGKLPIKRRCARHELAPHNVSGGIIHKIVSKIETVLTNVYLDNCHSDLLRHTHVHAH